MYILVRNKTIASSKGNNLPQVSNIALQSQQYRYGKVPSVMRRDKIEMEFVNEKLTRKQ